MVANRIEKGLARLGITLADGNPALIEQVKREKEAAAWQERKARRVLLSDASPEQLRETTAEALITFGEKANREATSLMRFACRVTAGKRAAGVMKNYIARGGACAEELRRFVAPLAQIENSETTEKSAPNRRVEVEAPQLRVVGGVS